MGNVWEYCGLELNETCLKSVETPSPLWSGAPKTCLENGEPPVPLWSRAVPTSLESIELPVPLWFGGEQKTEKLHTGCENFESSVLTWSEHEQHTENTDATFPLVWEVCSL